MVGYRHRAGPTRWYVKGERPMRTVHVLLLTVCVAFVIFPLAAQEVDPGPIAKSYQVTVKLDRFLQFEDAYRQHLQWHGKNNDAWAWHTWQVVSGQNLGQYIIRSHGHHWADFDRDASMRRSEWADILTHVAPHLEKMTSTLETFEPQLSNWPVELPRPALVELTRFEIAYDGVQDFREAIAKIRSAVMDKAPDRHYAWLRTVNGSDGPTMILAVPRATWSDFKPAETPLWALMDEVYGTTESGNIQKVIGQSIRSQQSFVIEYRADLSFVPSD